MQTIRGLVYKFKQLKEILRLEHLITLYKAFVESIVSYGIIGWSGVGNTFLRPLESIQKRIIKIIYRKHSLYPTDQLFSETKLFDVRQIYTYTLLIFQYKNKSDSQCMSHEYYTKTKEKQHFKTERIMKAIGQTLSILGSKKF